MKKTLVCALFTVASIAVRAQSDNGSSSENAQLKPSAKTFATELNFNPFKGNLSLNNSLNQVKFRYFVKEDLALRLGVNINQKDSVINSGNPYGTQSTYFENERKSTTLGINLGIEKHFKGTRRLSPYIGGEISLSNRSASQDMTNGNVNTSVKNGWIELIYQNQQLYYTAIVENAYNRFGINAFAGFDFYMAKNFFFGYEFNLGYAKTNYKTSEVIVTGQNNNSPLNTSKNSSSTFGTFLVNGIRIGYAF